MELFLLAGGVLFSVPVALLTVHFFGHADAAPPRQDLELFDPLQPKLDHLGAERLVDVHNYMPPEEFESAQIQ